MSFPKLDSVLNAKVRDCLKDSTEIIKEQSETFDRVCTVPVIPKLQVKATGGIERLRGDCQVVFHASTLAGLRKGVKGGFPPSQGGYTL